MVMILQILLPLCVPPQAMAITGGPGQPEFSSFTPVSISNMVDPFTGDFAYNIPLMDVGGYPVNISYSSGINMEQQATNVGLGWTLNAGGVITRSMRGIPDDFNGTDKIVSKTNLKPNVTVGANLKWGDVEIIGKRITGDIGIGAFYNNYTGIGFEANIDPTIGIGDKNGSSLLLGLGLSANSKEGIGVSPKVGLKYKIDEDTDKETRAFQSGSLTFTGYNSRAGLKSLGIDFSFKTTQESFDKTKKSTLDGRGMGSSIPIGYNTYVPQAGQSMLSNSVAVDIGTGLEAFWINGKLKVGGYFSSQVVKLPVKSKPAYGFLYADKGRSNPAALHDFNREKDGAFTKNTPALPMTQMTYDIYTASGQGVSGMFRPHRDFATVYDPVSVSNSSGNSFGGDLGAGQIFKGGINFTNTSNYSRTGPWTSASSNVAPKFKSKEDVANNALYEPFYMKNAGEFTTIDNDYFNKIQGTDPVRIDITEDGEALNKYKKRTSNASMNETTVQPIPDNTRTIRDKRNQPMTLLPAALAASGALDKEMASYEFTNPATGASAITYTPRFGQEGRKEHHVSEITVSRPDGMRYIFGSQAYNFKQLEVSFNTDDTPDLVNGFVGYAKNDDNTIGNRVSGTDHFFNSTEIPPYATAYQLTTALSTDYVDLEGDGVTPDDLGNYTKFNHSTIYDMNNPYKWRNPYQQNIANFNEGYKAKSDDNKGNYIYGEKEIKILHSIETKNYIAEFHYSDRKDAYDVIDENGGQGSNTLKKLDKISLYTRCDREENLGNAVPLKTVHFEYDYSLCKNLPSNNQSQSLTDNELANQGGKLTLKKVYFTYEDSKKGQLSPYHFHYGDANHDLTTDTNLNPDYGFRSNDRWGCYKPNDMSFPNTEEPYVTQDASSTNEYAAAWCMTTVQLPSGGLIKLDLESDDYAYVQNKRATQMLKVKGFSKDLNPGGSYSSSLFSGSDNNLYMYFDAPGVADEDEFRERYIGTGRDEIKELFFKFLIDATGEGDYEYIPGYATIESSGWDTGSQTGWVKIKSTTLKDNGKGAAIHPIAKTAMQYVRVNLPEFVQGRNPEDDIIFLDIIYELVAIMDDLITLAKGTNRALRDKGIGKVVTTQKSFIRLQSPNYKKLGGGLRVSKIVINDSWGTMSGNSSGDFDYGQTYEYSKVADDPASTIPVGESISSGVAVYEPFIGNEENPLRQPVAFSEDRKMAPDNHFYQETPYGEMFFPGPTVGYSQVKVSNLSRAGVSRTATGHVIHEFYTAKDFPVKIRQPKLDVKPKRPSFLRGLFKLNLKDYMTASQSHVIELNDMHGKSKAQYVYAEGNTTPISSVEYFYRQTNGNSLNNDITIIGKDGNVSTAKAGMDIDMVTDMRESKNETFSVFISTNLDVSLVPIPFLPFPLPLPSAWPKISSEETRFRSIANTKVITRYGIMEKSVAQDLGSYVSSENLAWDKETGQVLLTRTQNDFEDPVYAFSYPAHWGYDGMGQAYKNVAATIDPGTVSNLAEYFVPGDEVLLINDEIKAWVSEVTPGSISLLDIDGNSVQSSQPLLILRSGRRNQQSTPIGSITTLQNPIQGSQLAFDEVINAGAIEYKDAWTDFCECDSLLSSTNPYVNAQKGNYRLFRSYAFLTERTQSDKNRNTNIRKDGVFEEFDPFWQPNSQQDWSINTGQWTFASEVTLVSPYGFELENKDALGRYSAADYRYNNTLPIAVASNSRYKEMASDNFEDYDCEACPDDHFSFKESSPNITATEAHTGRRSIMVGPGATVEVEKIINACEDVEETQ